MGCLFHYHSRDSLSNHHSSILLDILRLCGCTQCLFAGPVCASFLWELRCFFSAPPLSLPPATLDWMRGWGWVRSTLASTPRCRSCSRRLGAVCRCVLLLPSRLTVGGTSGFSERLTAHPAHHACVTLGRVRSLCREHTTPFLH